MVIALPLSCVLTHDHGDCRVQNSCKWGSFYHRVQMSVSPQAIVPVEEAYQGLRASRPRTLELLCGEALSEVCREANLMSGHEQALQVTLQGECGHLLPHLTCSPSSLTYVAAQDQCI